MAVFDMAGTTVNEHNVVYKTLWKAITEKDPDFTLEEVLAEGAGKEKLHAIKSVFSLRDIDDHELAVSIFNRFLILLAGAYDTQEIGEQRNATLVFNTLRDNDIAVVLNTGYNRQTAEALVKKIGWEEGVHFDCLVTASDVAGNRPKPDMIFYAMDRLGYTEATEVIKVGDSTVDIEEGQNAGCGLSIGITTGAHTREQLDQANPHFIIDDLIELLPIVMV